MLGYRTKYKEYKKN